MRSPAESFLAGNPAGVAFFGLFRCVTAPNEISQFANPRLAWPLGWLLLAALMCQLRCPQARAAENEFQNPLASRQALLETDEDWREFFRRGDAVPGELLVRFKPNIASARKQSLLGPSSSEFKFLDGNGASIRRGQLQSRAGRDSVFEQLAVVTLKQGQDAGAALAHFQRQPEVLYAEPNFRVRLAAADTNRVPNDFEFTHLWNFKNTGQTGGADGADIRAPEAWLRGTGSRRVKIAVIDTGMDYFHPDLAANVWVNDEVPGDGLDNDGNGYIDDVHGYDFVTDDSDPFDDHGHGTHVAGIAGAVGNNKIGIAGVCWEVTLMAVKAFDETGNASIDHVVKAIRYAIDNGAHIINASWGHPERSRALQEAVAAASEAGVLFVAAAGNENSGDLIYPAIYEHVVAVGATDANDRRARFSNYNPRIDVSAPGDLILSTQPDSAYEFFSGTSMAAPHVSGLAALVLANHPNYSNRDLANILRNAVDPVSSDKPIGTGRVNAAKAAGIEAPLPFVKIDLPASIYGVVPIKGVAEGTNLSIFKVEYGLGGSPTNWTEIHSATTPANSGVLLDRFATPQLAEGTYTFRVTARNTAGQESSERKVVNVSNVHMDFPLNNDVLRAGEVIEIRGSVFGANRVYQLEYGRGPEPTAWSSAGLTLANGGSREVLDGVLATWNTRDLPADEFYSFRLTATANGQPAGEHVVRMVYLDSRLKRGWPQYLPLESTFPTNDWRHITVADLDGDGFQELTLVDPGNIDGKAARLLMYGHDGALRWEHELGRGEPYWDVPTVGDIDGDGKSEIFVDVGEPRRLQAFRFDGTPLGGNWPVDTSGAGFGKVLADLDGDGLKELIGLSDLPRRSSPGDTQQLIVVNAGGQIVRSWNLPVCERVVDAARIFPAVANVNEDPDLEIVVPYSCSVLACYSLKREGSPLWSAGVDGTIVSSPVIANVDNDAANLMEIVVGTYDKAGKLGGLYMIRGDGQRFSGWPVLLGESFTAPPALADLDGDGALEVCALSSSSELLHAVHHWGFELNRWPVGPVTRSSARTSPVVGDVDGDGSSDVVLASPGYWLLALTYGDLSNLGGVQAWNRQGLLIRPGGRGLRLIEGSGGAWHKSAAPTLADIDRDGRLDLVVASLQDRAYVPRGETAGRKGRSTIYVWELDAPFDAAKLPWPAFQGGPEHTGFFAPPKKLNQPPTITGLPDQIAAPGGRFVPLELDLFVDDPDHRPGQLKWAVTGQQQLKISLSTNRVATIEPPDASWTGSETLRFQVTDPGGLSAEAQAVFTVRAGYVPPAAVEDHPATLEDSALEIDALANDGDPNGGALSVLSFSRPRFGKVQRAASGRLLYTPKQDYSGPDEFSYTLSNGRGGLAIGSVKISVAPVNDPPDAATDYVITGEDNAASIDVLANDQDADDEPVKLVSFTEPKQGTLERLPDGAFRYNPHSNYHGSDEFTYKLADASGEESEGQVNLLVKSVNDIPESGDFSFTLNRNATFNLNYTAEDIEKDTLTYRVGKGPEHGELLTYPTVAAYTPHKNFVGTDSFTYIANDGQSDSREIKVIFTILDANNPPKLDNLSLITRHDQPLPIEFAISDLDGDSVVLRVATPPANGTVTGSGTNYVYQPNAGFLGDDSFNIEASDTVGGVTLARVDILVTDENTAPVAGELFIQARVNTPASITLKATDRESNPLTYEVFTSPLNGVLSGTPPRLTYTPNIDFAGPDRFTFKARDGELDSEEGTVSIAVKGLNEPPVATNQTVTVLRNTPATIFLNVTDADNDALTSPILKGPKNGRLAGRGTVFTYTPKPDFAGTDEFTYKTWDEHTFSRVAKVTLNVTSGPAEARLVLHSFLVRPDGTVQFALDTQPARNYEVLVSTNLVNWSTLASLRASASQHTFADTNAPASHARFYRALRTD